MDDLHTLRAEATAAGQGHIFRFWEELGRAQREGLLGQVRRIDFDLTNRLAERAMKEMHGTARPPRELQPAPVVPIPTTPEQKGAAAEARRRGETLIRGGKVGLVLVAGGQGTRLGFDGPKGTYPVAPISGKSLFELHAEKIRAASKRYGVRLPWYIMTSEHNDAATREFFEEHDRFGLSREDVFFFPQRMLPAVDFGGKIILDRPDHIFMSPNGHGGCLLALHESGALDDMRARGIEELSYFQVDNVLVRILDPVFFGYHTAGGAEMSLKVVRKRSPEEKLGVVGYLNGRLSVIEYSDLSEEEMFATTPDGGLRYWAGSIAVHMLNVGFVARQVEEGFRLPYHFARKPIPHVDATGSPCWSEEPNGIKFETFIFDALPFAERSAVMEVRREDEFSPVKNLDGPDSVETAQRDMSDMFGRWIEAAGAEVARGGDGHVRFPIEISPFYALEAEDLVGRLPRGFKVDRPTALP